MNKKTFYNKTVLFFLALTFLKTSLLPFDISTINSTPSSSQTQEQTNKIYQKDWNFMVYIAANNDLNKFAQKNINQMMQVGSTNNLNILLQCDTYGKREISRYYIEKNKAICLDTQSNTQASTTGTPESLYEFVKWGITNFPAKYQALVLWNHGSGIEDPSMWGRRKGIAFNEFFQEYLTNQDLKSSLAKISKTLLGGRKINLLGMDACNMAMLEVGTQIKDYVDYMVSSEEVEPGTGWNYSLVLNPFPNRNLTPQEFSAQIVQAYKDQYLDSHSDFTQSAICLNNYSDLENNINNVATTLLALLKGDDQYKTIQLLKRIRNNTKLTTMFAQKSYIDLHHFLSSLLQKTKTQTQYFINQKQTKTLIELLENSLNLIDKHVIANVVSNYTPNARGISIYFPTKEIHPSYLKTDFAQNNAWLLFVDTYIRKTK